MEGFSDLKDVTKSELLKINFDIINDFRFFIV